MRNPEPIAPKIMRNTEAIANDFEADFQLEAILHADCQPPKIMRNTEAIANDFEPDFHQLEAILHADCQPPKIMRNTEAIANDFEPDFHQLEAILHADCQQFESILSNLESALFYTDSESVDVVAFHQQLVAHDYVTREIK
jgi:hypothetical protein